MNTELTVYDKENFVFPNLETEKLATGFGFTEGPVWHPGGFLLFSDIPANKIFMMDPEGKVSVYLDKSGFSSTDASLLSDMIGSNGLAIDANKNIVVCQHGDHALSFLDTQKKLSVLAAGYENRPFNSPNDVTVSKDGSIYFTDPPYGLKDQVLHPAVFQLSAGIYRYYKNETFLLNTDMRYPNGICFSPCEEFLYAGSNHPDEPFIWKYTLENGTIKDRSVFIEHNADGIKADSGGRVYLATDAGILIVSPAGKRIALIGLPESPANLAWREERKELYVTARSSIYRIKNFK